MKASSLGRQLLAGELPLAFPFSTHSPSAFCSGMAVWTAYGGSPKQLCLTEQIGLLFNPVQKNKTIRTKEMATVFATVNKYNLPSDLQGESVLDERKTNVSKFVLYHIVGLIECVKGNFNSLRSLTGKKYHSAATKLAKTV